ncbi:similar to Saccharomyces cerevisiae YDR198C RKM2 Ribosomal protein lysine methyltransferase, responsible for trimethylation of the lysine residue at position 3 of Rpl12Ap and Rpl12Bp [Maudiozyma saulgeensis]|uniref:Similar to Saccharomyces cerevisiae YDR198C RKM2 Ribosomal protein lysine methyltransferase, responsible for trimethylation of the lysine residue at position 3 of Rpl12Ap and Rpl12Bp n=1 Tax=Maudiozyma saulgeensis TaxID=1789683 RepID=A0A1X7R5W2_9SACH|nr:similar to Saccharomyces cerevisiae YDR198C RKM2 Ribosomal protein lysine methyltransferase, responsible for trimethylation of the lysine residue at position 3 of Rpl12Ap and Rpl12Bp [Kazachstania saulgeensis]
MHKEIDQLISWLQQSNDFYLNEKVAVKNIPNEGKGIVLLDGQIRRNEIVISIPSTHQINFNSVLYHISKFNSNINVPHITHSGEEQDKISHMYDEPRVKAYNIFTTESLLKMSSFQLLSLYILAEWIFLPKWSSNTIDSYWKPFFNVWPKIDDLKSIPAIWENSNISQYKLLLPFLTSDSENHCQRLNNLISHDWAVIQPILEEWLLLFDIQYNIEDVYEDYLHVYFIINSRCLYSEIPLKKEDIASKFTLVPYVDFINHSAEMDRFCFPKIEYTHANISDVGQFVIRGGPYTYKIPNEQILFNYGPHSNDFLLNEYGFTLPTNSWNYLDITYIINDIIGNDNDVTKYLKTNDYWGEYTINQDGFNYRATVALSLFVTKDYQRVDKLILGYMSEDYFANKIVNITTEILNNLLLEYQQKNDALINLDTYNETDPCFYNLSNIYKGHVDMLTDVKNKL